MKGVSFLKKISFLFVFCLCIGLFINIASAAIFYNHFSFEAVGDYDIGVEANLTSSPSVVVNHYKTDADAQLGISVQSKKFLIGWGIDARSNVWIKGETRTVVDFFGLSSKTYRPVLVFNATNDGKAVEGEYYITNAL